MPDYTVNVLECDRIQNFPIFYENENTGDRMFDFNLLIPMPSSLLIEDSSRTDDIIEMTKMVQQIRNTLHIQLTGCYFTDKQAIEDAVDCMEDTIETAETCLKLTTMLRQISNVKKKWDDTDFYTLVELGNVYLSNIQLYGYPTWFDWSIKNWGTKWNSVETWFPANENRIIFLTAWLPPIPVLVELSKKYPLETFRLWFADEDVGSGTGYYCFQNGKMKGVKHPDGSKEALETFRYCVSIMRGIPGIDESVFSKI